MDPWIRMFLKDLRDNLFKMVLSIQSPFTPSKMGHRNVQSVVQRNNTQMSLNSVELDSLFWYHIKDFFFFFYDVTLKIKKKNEPSHSVWILKGHSGTSFILAIMKPNYSFTILYLTFSSIVKRNVELTFRKFFFLLYCFRYIVSVTYLWNFSFSHFSLLPRSAVSYTPASVEYFGENRSQKGTHPTPTIIDKVYQ